MSNGPVDGENKSSPSPSRWSSLFKWFTPITSQLSAQSERTLLEAYGDCPYDDKDHFKIGPTPVANDSPDHFMHTLLLDENTLSSSGEERLNIVICHGFGSGIGFFYRNFRPLSQNIPSSRIYAIDWLGMGRSGRPLFPMFQGNAVDPDITSAIDFFLDSFEAWRSKQNGLEKFILVGHSLGGYLSALYALKYPERVQKLILASPVGLPEASDPTVTVTGHKIPTLVARMWNSNYTPQGLLRGLGPFGKRFASGYIEKRFAYLPLEERSALADYFYHISADRPSGEYALAALLAPGAWAREPLHKRLPDLQMPCTFIYGQHDWMDKKHAEELAVRMKKAKVISVEGADHHLYRDNFLEFNRIITEECTINL